MIFESILSQLLEKHPSVLGAVFCAHDGEMVSLVCRDEKLFQSYDLKVIAAYASIWMRNVSQSNQIEVEGIRLSFTTSKFGVLIHGLPGGYYLMALTKQDALLGHVAYSLKRAAIATCNEM